MRWLGEWRDQGYYYPGDVVRFGGRSYVCTARPLISMDGRADTFTRADQDGWGTASDGHIWTTRDAPVSPSVSSIASDRGVLLCDSDYNTDRWLLGDSLVTSDAELLVRWQCTTSAGDFDGVKLEISYEGAVSVTVYLNSHLDLQVATATNTALTWAGGDSSHAYWTRIRQDNGTLTVRTWQDGSTEPATWDADWYSGQTDIAVGRVGLTDAASNPSTAYAFDSLSVRSLRPVAARPDADAAHWDVLSTA